MKITLGDPGAFICAALYFFCGIIGVFMIWLSGAELREDWLKIFCVLELPILFLCWIMEKLSLGFKKFQE